MYNVTFNIMENKFSYEQFMRYIKNESDEYSNKRKRIDPNNIYNIRRTYTSELQKIHSIDLEETKTVVVHFDVYEDDFGKEDLFVYIPDVPEYCYLYIDSNHLDIANITYINDSSITWMNYKNKDEHIDKKVRIYKINLIYVKKCEDKMMDFIFKYYTIDKPYFIERVYIKIIG